MTAMATGGLADSEKGWRLALRHALGDVFQPDILETRRGNPQSEAIDLFDFE